MTFQPQAVGLLGWMWDDVRALTQDKTKCLNGTMQDETTHLAETTQDENMFNSNDSHVDEQ